ncbi:MAG: Eco57I restriction-modification methylase domain-containing protein [bacterium JZ-2024 1]
MNREQAKGLIINTFENRFDKNNFIIFLKNLLKRFDEKTFTYQGNLIPDAFEQYITSLERIGQYICQDKEIDLLIVQLKKETSLERARTMQRNFIAWYLKGSRGGKLKDAALVAFISPDNEDWRFSLVKIDYRFEETPSGKIKVTEEFTPARRWSYLVGKNEKSHTAQTRFIPILEDDYFEPTLEDLEQAFNVEVVTKEFFEKYRDLFIRTKLELDKIAKKDANVQAEFRNKNINTIDFTKKLLGQIVFLYFLQKKGWFGVEKDKPWGTGPKDFIRSLFNKKFGNYQNFYNDILEPLFYEALRTDRSSADHYYSKFNCKIPFLNGGLFDPLNNFDWVKNDILLPNELFSNQNRTREGDIGDGILDVFDRFNFTVNEEEPLEKEVALDPELLGKIYEKLNAIRPDNFDEYVSVLKSGKKGEETKFNKEYGVYYTPREIVHYMCQESLINYLATELQGKVAKGDIEKFVKFADSIREVESIAMEREEKIKSGEQKTTIYQRQIPESVQQHAKEIDNLLFDIKVCDPAVGSGAFPIGMMHEIVKLRQLLSIYLGTKVNPYHLKSHCIENSLYGVDIDPGAVEICKLRFWLSLIVDEEDFYNIKPLPNLDYKIVCGDSLLGVEKDLYNQEAFKNLEELKPEYFNETNPLRKQELKKKIDELISEITKGHKKFDFEVYFSEVFHKKGGFDVVIANPPYSGILRNREQLIQQYEFFDSRKNSASFFIEKGRRISKPQGIISFIVPKSLTFSKGWEPARSFILEENILIDVVDVSEAFEEVLLEQVIITFKNSKTSASYIFTSGEGWHKEIKRIGVIPSKLAKRLQILPIYISDNYSRILQKIEGNAVSLKSISKTFRGMPFQNRCSNIGSTLVIRGDNIGKFLIYGKIHRLDLTKKDYENRKINILMQPKIISQNIVAHVSTPIDRIIIMATYDKEGLLTLDTVMNTFLLDKKFSYEYVLSILNSRLAEWFYYWFVYNRAVRTMHFDESYMGNLPIKMCEQKQQEPFISLVDQILLLTHSSDYLSNPQKQGEVKELEREIDNLVYKLYGLTEEEIRIVEGAV